MSVAVSKVQAALQGIESTAPAPRQPSSVEDHVYETAMAAVDEKLVFDERSLADFRRMHLVPALSRARLPQSRQSNLKTYFNQCVRASLSAGSSNVRNAVRDAGSFRGAYEKMYFTDLIHGRPLGSSKTDTTAP